MSCRQILRFQPRACLTSLRYASTTAPDLMATVRTALKESMKAKDQFRSGVLKSTLGELQSASYAPEGQEAPSPTKVLLKAIKKRQEAVSTFSSSGRQDLAEQYERELTILKDFVKEEASAFSAEDIEKLVYSAMEALGVSQHDKAAVGKVIKYIRDASPSVDGKHLAATAKKLITGS